VADSGFSIWGNSMPGDIIDAMIINRAALEKNWDWMPQASGLGKE